MKLQLLPCYEGTSYPGRHTPFHFLHGEMTDAELRAFLAAVFAYGYSAKQPDTLAETAELMLQREFQVLSGGLMAIKGDFVAEPGCCCGLEGWRDWQHALTGSGTPWLGHDPAPAAIPLESAILLHTDYGNEEDDETLPVTYPEFEEAYEGADTILRAFMDHFEKWLTAEIGIAGTELSARLRAWFQISPG